MSEVPLTTDQLDRYLELLRSIDAPIVTEFKPGLTDEQVAEFEAELQCTLAPEIRTLWQWKTPPEPTRDGDWQFLAQRELLPPGAALRVRSEQREFLYDAPGLSSSWIPIMTLTHHAVLLADSSVTDGVSPVMSFHFEDGAGTIAAPSIAALIAYWSKLIEEGHVVYDEENQEVAVGRRMWPGAS